jgi:transcriptional regulator with XRE-family HTH domain
VAVLAGNPSLPQLSVSSFWRAFVEALRERGWDEGRNIVFHLRAGEGIEERYPEALPIPAISYGLSPAGDGPAVPDDDSNRNSRHRSSAEPSSRLTPPPLEEPPGARGATMRAKTNADLTQTQLAERLKTDQGNIARLERGRTQATIRTLKRIAEAPGHSLIVDRDEPLVDDLVLGVWAVIALLGAARECDDAADLSGLVSKAEQILSAVIPHLAALALTGPSASMSGALH